jgi:hypothetical protein
MNDSGSMGTASRSDGGGRGGVTQPVVALLVMFLLAVFGAVLNWTWWLEYAVLVPPAIWLIISGDLVMYRQLKPGSKDHRLPVPLVGLIMVPAALQATRFSGMAMFVAFAIVYLFSRHGASDGSRVRSVNGS